VIIANGTSISLPAERVFWSLDSGGLNPGKEGVNLIPADIYGVAGLSVTGGTLTANKAAALAGDLAVTLTVAPAAYYELQAAPRLKEAGTTTYHAHTSVTGLVYTFTMPAADVEGDAAFAQNQGIGTIRVVFSGAPQDESFTLTGGPLYWGDDTAISFTAPASYSYYTWYIDGAGISTLSPPIPTPSPPETLTLTARQLSPGRHRVTVEVIDSMSQTYSKTVFFEVVTGFSGATSHNINLEWKAPAFITAPATAATGTTVTLNVEQSHLLVLAIGYSSYVPTLPPPPAIPAAYGSQAGLTYAGPDLYQFVMPNQDIWITARFRDPVMLLLADVPAYLLYLGVNTPSTPYPLKLVDFDYNDSTDVSTLQSAINTAGKYISLDLSECPGTGLGTELMAMINSTGGYITALTLPDTVSTIGSSAFISCISLRTVTLPSALTSIGNNTFAGCTGLGTVTFTGTTPPSLGTAPFPTVLTTVRVPMAALPAYTTALSGKIGSASIVGY
jgi:hypothetical protein